MPEQSCPKFTVWQLDKMSRVQIAALLGGIDVEFPAGGYMTKAVAFSLLGRLARLEDEREQLMKQLKLGTPN